MAALELRGIVKAFGQTPVLHGIDLSVGEGEFVVLLGPSGCGKSTLLRIVAGLEDADAGDIIMGGKRANDLEPRDREIAMVFQRYALYPHMTVAQNIGFALSLAGEPREQINAAVGRAAAMLGLGDLLERYPKALSGGQRQRVAMGRALVRRTSLFLFDEPLSNLDAKLRAQMRIEISDLHRNMGVTSIYVTHDQIEAMTLADRVVVMKDGRIEQVGEPLSIFDRPANIFVAQFLGSPSMNLVDARIMAGRGMTRGGSSLVLPEHLRSEAMDGREIVLGLRPQHLDFAPDGDDDGALACRVRFVEATGVETLVHGLVDGEGSAPICIATGERRHGRPGDALRLKARPDQTHVFDAATGARL